MKCENEKCNNEVETTYPSYCEQCVRDSKVFFNYVQDEAKFRLRIKRKLREHGLILDYPLKNTITTEELLKLQDKMENLKNV